MEDLNNAIQQSPIQLLRSDTSQRHGEVCVLFTNITNTFFISVDPFVKTDSCKIF